MRLPALRLRQGDQEILGGLDTCGHRRGPHRKASPPAAIGGAGLLQPGHRRNRRSALQPGRHVAPTLRPVWTGRTGRPGALRPPCVYDHDEVLLLVKTVTEEPPDGATRWTMDALA